MYGCIGCNRKVFVWTTCKYELLDLVNGRWLLMLWSENKVFIEVLLRIENKLIVFREREYYQWIEFSGNVVLSRRMLSVQAFCMELSRLCCMYVCVMYVSIGVMYVCIECMYVMYGMWLMLSMCLYVVYVCSGDCWVDCELWGAGLRLLHGSDKIGRM